MATGKQGGEAIRLRGMTWSHPRGYDPMVGCSRLWAGRTGVGIEWEKRSLQGFESHPVEELARAYDLIVIDHPHVGQITREGCLAPLDGPGRADALVALAAGSVGRSFASYTWQGHQWALPIDAATQVLAWRPDLLAAPPATWAEVAALAREGRVRLPLRSPHGLMCFYTLAANLGTPCAVNSPELIAPDAGARVWEVLREVADHAGRESLAQDPIATFEEMAADGSAIACAPLIYGYMNYGVAGFRPRLVRFADIAPAGDHGPAGSTLGGTGIAVSAFSKHREAATDFAFWIASADIQRGLYAQSGGQPGHAAAWEDDRVNAGASDFYRATRATLEGAWVRPRHDGYMAFQQAAGQRVTDALGTREGAATVLRDLNRLYRESLAHR